MARDTHHTSVWCSLWIGVRYAPTGADRRDGILLLLYNQGQLCSLYILLRGNPNTPELLADGFDPEATVWSLPGFRLFTICHRDADDKEQRCDLQKWGWCRIRHSEWGFVIGWVPLVTVPLCGCVLLTMILCRPRAHEPGHCVQCGYDLRAHSPGQRCSECGTLIPAKSVDTSGSGGSA